MSALVVSKGTGLTKTSKAVRELASRLERAAQSRNEKVARADAEYVDACRRAMADVTPEHPVVSDVPAVEQPAVSDADQVAG